MADTDSDIWEPLRHPLRWTRVFTIQPGSADLSISLSMYQIELSKRNAYECISYTWGDDMRSREVNINGKSHQMRENLWAFLHVLREQGQVAPLWVDAVSIKQDDLVEKSKQVSIIGEIFGTARTTHIWLGDEADDSSRYMDAVAAGFTPVATMSDLLMNSSERWALCHNQEESASERFIDYDTLLAKTEDPKLRSLYISWHAMVMRPYWGCTWIVQEVLRSENLMVHCGNRKVPWEQFWLLRGDPSESYSPDFSGGAGLISDHLLTERSKPGKRDLFSLIGDFAWGTRCTDPKDKVYALLPLVRELAMKEPLQIDYTIDLIELFVRTIDYCVEKDPDITCFSGQYLAAQLGLTTEEVAEAIHRRPSWSKEYPRP